MRIRNLDENGDWVFGLGKSSYLITQPAVILNIKTRLKSFLNDTFWNMGFGIDWLNYLGNKKTQMNIVLACRAMILQSYGVTQINSFGYTVNPNGRIITLNFNVNTIFSTNANSSLILGA